MDREMDILRGISAILCCLALLALGFLIFTGAINLTEMVHGKPVHVTVIVEGETVLEYDGTADSYRSLNGLFTPSNRYRFDAGNKIYYFDNPQIIVEKLEEK